MDEREAALAILLSAGLVADVSPGRVALKGGRTRIDLGGLMAFRDPFVVIQDSVLFRALVAWRCEAVQEHYGRLDFVVHWICKLYGHK